MAQRNPDISFITPFFSPYIFSYNIIIPLSIFSKSNSKNRMKSWATVRTLYYLSFMKLPYFIASIYIYYNWSILQYCCFKLLWIFRRNFIKAINFYSLSCNFFCFASWNYGIKSQSMIIRIFIMWNNSKLLSIHKCIWRQSSITSIIIPISVCCTFNKLLRRKIL